MAAVFQCMSFCLQCQINPMQEASSPQGWAFPQAFPDSSNKVLTTDEVIFLSLGGFSCADCIVINQYSTLCLQIACANYCTGCPKALSSSEAKCNQYRNILKIKAEMLISLDDEQSIQRLLWYSLRGRGESQTSAAGAGNSFCAEREYKAVGNEKWRRKKGDQPGRERVLLRHSWACMSWIANKKP